MRPQEIIGLITLLLPILERLLTALHQHPETTPDARALLPALTAQHDELVALADRVREVQIG